MSNIAASTMNPEQREHLMIVRLLLSGWLLS